MVVLSGSYITHALRCVDPLNDFTSVYAGDVCFAGTGKKVLVSISKEYAGLWRKGVRWSGAIRLVVIALSNLARTLRPMQIEI